MVSGICVLSGNPVNYVTGDPENTQGFIQNVKIKLDYFRDYLTQEIDKVSLIITHLKDSAKE